mgnify:CR=1 FL=1
MKQLLIVIISFWAFCNVNAQIVIDNNPPYDNPTWLIDNILLDGRVVAYNHSYQCESVQIKVIY